MLGDVFFCVWGYFGRFLGGGPGSREVRSRSPEIIRRWRSTRTFDDTLPSCSFSLAGTLGQPPRETSQPPIGSSIADERTQLLASGSKPDC